MSRKLPLRKKVSPEVRVSIRVRVKAAGQFSYGTIVLELVIVWLLPSTPYDIAKIQASGMKIGFIEIRGNFIFYNILSIM